MLVTFLAIVGAICIVAGIIVGCWCWYDTVENNLRWLAYEELEKMDYSMGQLFLKKDTYSAEDFDKRAAKLVREWDTQWRKTVKAIPTGKRPSWRS